VHEHIDVSLCRYERQEGWILDLEADAQG